GRDRDRLPTALSRMRWHGRILLSKQRLIAISHVHMDGGPTGSASTDDPGDPGGDGRDRDTDCEQHDRMSLAAAPPAATPSPTWLGVICERCQRRSNHLEPSRVDDRCGRFSLPVPCRVTKRSNCGRAVFLCPG